MDDPVTVKNPESAPLTLSEDYADFEVSRAELFSMELRTIAVTGDEIKHVQILTVNNVLSFSCLCSKCGQSFDAVSSLKLHMRTHLQSEANIPYSTESTTVETNVEITVIVPGGSNDVLDGASLILVKESDNNNVGAHDINDKAHGLNDGAHSHNDGSCGINDGIHGLHVGALDAHSAHSHNDGALSINDGAHCLNDGACCINDGAHGINGGADDLNDRADINDGSDDVIDQLDYCITTDAPNLGSIEDDENIAAKVAAVSNDNFIEVDNDSKTVRDGAFCIDLVDGGTIENTNGTTCTQNSTRTATGERTPSRIEKDNALSCNECGRIFKRAKALVEHSSIHTGMDSYQCTVCGWQFRLKGFFNKHMKTHTKPHLCSACGKTFPALCDLKKHMAFHTRPDARPYKVRRPRRHKDTPIICNECGKVFKRYKALDEHRTIHTGIKPYQCTVCGWQFRRNNFLTKHMKSHTGVKPHLCSACGKTFSELFHLKKHMELHTRPDARPYKERRPRRQNKDAQIICNACGKVFKRYKALDEHRSIHTGIKPYQCTVCSRQFRCNNILTKHMKTHTGVKPHLCSACGKTFVELCDLKKHMALHTRPDARPYKERRPKRQKDTQIICNECGKVFKRYKALDEHSSIHTGIKPYQCTVCGKQFRRNNFLNKHMKTHTGL